MRPITATGPSNGIEIAPDAVTRLVAARSGISKTATSTRSGVTAEKHGLAIGHHSSTWDPPHPDSREAELNRSQEICAMS